MADTAATLTVGGDRTSGQTVRNQNGKILTIIILFLVYMQSFLKILFHLLPLVIKLYEMCCRSHMGLSTQLSHVLREISRMNFGDYFNVSYQAYNI